MLGTYLYKPGTTDKIDYSDPALNKADFGKILYCADENNDPNNNNEIYCNTEPGYYTTSYILKSFIPYSMQYTKKDHVNGNVYFDVTINYTLDNYISVSGTIKQNDKDVYYTKSGYLINPDEINSINIGEGEYNLSNIQDLPLNNVDELIDELVDGDGVNDGKVYVEFSNKVIISSDDNSATSTGVDGKEISDNISALKYYIKAYIFSTWVRDNLSEVSEEYINDDFINLQSDFNIKQSGFSLEDDVKLFYDYGDSKIFETKDGKFNVENIDSNFYEHKRRVIQNSIQYNLNLAMAIYNAGEGDEYYQMPILSEVEWDKLLSNVSILAFMQGFPCGLKTYSNYALVTSTNNEVMTNVDSIYYIPIDIDNSTPQGLLTSDTIKQNSDLDTCHRIDCVNSSYIDRVKNSEYFQSFASKEIKYDKEYDYSTNSYVYDHGANTCLYCIVNSNYNSVLKDAMDYYNEFYILNDIKNNKPDIEKKYGNSFEEALTKFGIENQTEIIEKLLTAKYIAIGKIRNNTYKSLAFKTNYGIRTENESSIIFSANSINSYDYDGDGNIIGKSNKEIFSNEIFDSYDLANCYEIAITINKKLKNSNPFILKLGDEGKNINSSGIETIYFKSPNDWNRLNLILQNQEYNEVQNFDDNGRSNNGIELLSITYKYK